MKGEAVEKPVFAKSLRVHQSPLSVNSPIANNKYSSVLNFLAILICAFTAEVTESIVSIKDWILPPSSSVSLM